MEHRDDQPRPELGAPPGLERRAKLNRRLRAAFLEGAEEDSRRRLSRGLTVEELQRVLDHYPGDLPEHS